MSYCMEASGSDLIFSRRYGIIENGIQKVKGEHKNAEYKCYGLPVLDPGREDPEVTGGSLVIRGGKFGSEWGYEVHGHEGRSSYGL